MHPKWLVTELCKLKIRPEHLDLLSRSLLDSQDHRSGLVFVIHVSAASDNGMNLAVP